MSTTNYPLPTTSKKRIDDIYIPTMKSIQQIGRNMNQKRKQIEGFEPHHSHASIEHFESQIQTNINNTNTALTSTNNTNNTNIDTYQIQRETLYRTEQLNDIENKDIENQYKKMENLQSSIFTKERLIEENLYQAEKHELQIRIITGSMLFILILFVVIVMYGIGTIDNIKLTKYCIFILILYVLFLTYQYNIFYLRDSLSNIFTLSFFQGLGERIEIGEEQMKRSVQRFKYGIDYDEWKSKNCGICPSNNPSEISAMEYSGEQLNPTQGFYYQDGSTPNQLIYPTNTLDNSGRYQDTIHHIDTNLGTPMGPTDGKLTETNTYTAGL